MASYRKTPRKAPSRKAGTGVRAAPARRGRKKGTRASSRKRISRSVQNRNEEGAGTSRRSNNELKYIQLGTIRRMMKDIVGHRSGYRIAKSGAFGLSYLIEMIVQDLIKYSAKVLEAQPKKQVTIMPKHLMEAIQRNNHCRNGIYRAISNPKLKDQISSLNTSLNEKMDIKPARKRTIRRSRSRSRNRSRSRSRSRQNRMSTKSPTEWESSSDESTTRRSSRRSASQHSTRREPSSQMRGSSKRSSASKRRSMSRNSRKASHPKSVISVEDN